MILDPAFQKLFPRQGSFISDLAYRTISLIERYYYFVGSTWHGQSKLMGTWFEFEWAIPSIHFSLTILSVPHFLWLTTSIRRHCNNALEKMMKISSFWITYQLPTTHGDFTRSKQMTSGTERISENCIFPLESSTSSQPVSRGSFVCRTVMHPFSFLCQNTKSGPVAVIQLRAERGRQLTRCGTKTVAVIVIIMLEWEENMESGRPRQPAALLRRHEG